MPESIQTIINNEKLLWKGKKYPSKRDTVFGIILIIVFAILSILCIFYWNDFINYVSKYSTFIQFVIAILVLETPILLLGTAIIHIVPDPSLYN